jgi:hypothetical protein
MVERNNNVLAQKWHKSGTKSHRGAIFMITPRLFKEKHLVMVEIDKLYLTP